MVRVGQAVGVGAVAAVLIGYGEAATGNCTGSSDVAYWKEEGFAASEAKLEICGKTTLGAEGQLEACVDREFGGYSNPCQYCFENVIRCTAVRCAGSCVGSLFSDPSEKCRECVVTKCNAPFAECAGFQIDSCDDCVIDADGLPVGLIVGGSVGGLVVIVLGACLVRCMLKPPLSEEEKAMRLEKRIQGLGIQEITAKDPETGNFSKAVEKMGVPQPSPARSTPDALRARSDSFPDSVLDDPDAPEF